MTGNSSLITGDTVGQPATTVIRSGSSYTGDWFVVGNNDLGIVKSAGNINANAGLIVGGAATSGAANGYMVHTAGTINTAGLSIADSSNSFGSYVLSGGTINETSGDAIIANNSNGIMTIMPGAAFNVADGAFMSFHMGGSGGLGVMVQRGGSVSFSSNAAYDTLVNQMQIQVNSGSDVYNQLGGTVSAASYDSASATPNVSGIGGIGLIWYNGWNPGDDNMSMAIYNLNGGTLTTSNIHSGSIWNGSNNLYAYLNFHGGTLQAAADSTNFIYHVLGTASGAGTAAVDMPNGITAATVYKEGAVIDTNGHNITIQTALVKPDGQGVSNIAVMTAGSGYLSAPIIRLDTATGDTGIGATAIADMVQDPDGTYHIADIAITNPGTGYGAAPTVTILGGNPATTATLGVPVLSLNDSSGGLTKQGSGILTLTGALTYGGLTDIQAGTLQINTSSVPVSLAAITGASDAALGVGDGTNATSLTATSVSVGTLTLGAGSTLTIAAIPGGPLAGPGGISAVPEPSTITLLALAGTGLLIAAWRKRQS
jgi:autotransporter-associated beta strand protein